MRSPDDVSVNEGECENEDIGGLLVNEMEGVTLTGVHRTPMNPGMVSAGTGRLNPDGGSVDAHLKPAPCEFRDGSFEAEAGMRSLPDMLVAYHGLTEESS